MFELQWPWLLLLIPVPLLMLFISTNKKEEAALRVPFFEEVAHLQTQNHHHRIKANTRSLALWSIWLCCVLAAANPQWIGEPVSMPNSGRDLLMAVDLSGSMEIQDIDDHGHYIPRLIAIKRVVGNFIEHRKSDRMGLILFGSQAYLQAPLTYDTKTVNTLLQEALIGFAGTGTAIGDAIGLGVKRLQSRPDAQRVIVLLTDGENTDGNLSPSNAADLAQQNHVKVYVIGFGSDLTSRNGERLTPINEPAMHEIADKTGGKYFRARDLEELSDIHNELNELEPIESDKETFRPVKDLFYWPLSVALILSILWAVQFILAQRELNHAGNNQ